MTLSDELRELATELAGIGWREVDPSFWTPQQRAAHDRWMERMDRIDPAGQEHRRQAEWCVMLRWPVMVVGSEVLGPVSRAEIEADPAFAEDEHLRRWLDGGDGSDR